MFPLNWNIPFIRKNGSRTTLGAITGDIAGIEEDITELTDNKVSWEDFSDLGAVNKFYCADATQESGGLTITRNTDDSFSISAGTTNAEINLPSSETQAIEQAKLLTAGETYKFSIGVANANVKLQVLYKSSSAASWSSLAEATNVSELVFTVPSDITSTGRIWTRINIASGKTIPALTFYPMVAQISYNGPYVPYAMTNRELTEDVANLFAVTTRNGSVFDISISGGYGGTNNARALVLGVNHIGLLTYSSDVWNYVGLVATNSITITESNKTANGLRLTFSTSTTVNIIPLNLGASNFTATYVS